MCTRRSNVVGSGYCPIHAVEPAQSSIENPLSDLYAICLHLQERLKREGRDEGRAIETAGRVGEAS